MSSDRGPRFPLERVALVGGGRWSRVLLPVMKSLLQSNAEIIWATEHGKDRARRWLSENQVDHVTLCTHADIGKADLDAAVVATMPSTHGQQVRTLLECGIPTLCEKPLTLAADEAVELQQIAEHLNCPLGVNLELYFASFVEEFAEAVRGQGQGGSRVRQVEIVWKDPWSEIRYGEVKNGDIYTSIVDDMWPHCWSLLRRLCPGEKVRLLEQTEYRPMDGSVSISTLFGEAKVKVTLSRRSEQRVRTINVNGGEAILDFSQEPGHVVIDGVTQTNQWRGERPLSRSLSSFFEVATSRSDSSWAQHWELSVHRCLDSVRSAQAIGSDIRQLQWTLLSGFRETGIDLTDEGHRNLVVDLLLPVCALQNQRWPAVTLEEQNAFIRYVCETQGLRCK